MRSRWKRFAMLEVLADSLALVEALCDADVLADSLALVDALCDADVICGFARTC